MNHPMPTWRRRLLRTIALLEAGKPDHITCLLPMDTLSATPAQRLNFLRHLLTLTMAEAKADPDGHAMTPSLIAAGLAMAPEVPRPISLKERHQARAFAHRLWDLQPGFKRIWVHAGRRKGKDGRLLMLEDFLHAIYDVHPFRRPDDGWDDRYWKEDVAIGPRRYGFYKVTARYISRWDNLRFRLDRHSIPRIRMVIDWWDSALTAL